MNIRKASRSAFTLIEMLMVIVIIFMLSMITFRMMKMLDDRANVAKTVFILKQLQNALNEYKMEYGIYPPVDFVEYEYESPTNQPAFFREWLTRHNDALNPDANPGVPPYFWADMAGREPNTLGWTPSSYYPSGSWNMGYRYGLVAHLDYRRRSQAHWYDKDSPRDIAAKDKWACFMDDGTHKLVSGDGFRSKDANVIGTISFYSNKVDTIKDGFGNTIKYECYPPYTSYRLWSVDDQGVTIDSAAVGGAGGLGNFSN